MAPASYLVNVDWLQQHLDDPDIVVVDTRFSLTEPALGRSQYEAGHIPGAYYLDLNQDMSSPVADHGGRHPLPDWSVFAAKLSALGIHSHPPAGPTQVVIYDDSRFAFAARLWWMLRYLGHERVAILDGGIRAWAAAGFPLSQAIPAAKTGDFRPQPQTDWLVNIATLRQQKESPDVVVIDARSPERYRGEVEPIDPIAGSIPGAINAFWQAVSTPDGYLKPNRELTEYWASLLPAPNDSKEESAPNVIVYCGSGVTACVDLFSMVMAGRPMYRLYAGGWSDWCSYLELSD